MKVTPKAGLLVALTFVVLAASPGLSATLEDQLLELAKRLNTKLPTDLGNGIVLRTVAVNGKTLNYIYDADLDSKTSRAEIFRRERGVLQLGCRALPRDFARAGGAFKYFFVDREGHIFSTVVANRKTCQ